MDLGSINTSEFTVFDSSVVDEPAQVAQLLATSHLKVSTARLTRRQLGEQLRLLQDVYHASLDHGKASVRSAMVPRVTALLTLVHLLDRYILLMARDCLRLEACLRGPIPSSFVHAWRESQRELRLRTPNIHDYFLWRVTSSSQDDEDNSFSGSLPDLVLWRPID